MSNSDDSNEVNIGAFISVVLKSVIYVLIFSYLGVVFLFYSFYYSIDPENIHVKATDPLYIPYTPLPFSQSGGGPGKSAFDVLDEFFSTDKWNIPYKNYFTESIHKSGGNQTASIIGKLLGLWPSHSMADFYAYSRWFLQLLLGGVGSSLAIKNNDMKNGMVSKFKLMHYLAFLGGGVFFLLMILLIWPYSFFGTIAGLIYNIPDMFPSSLFKGILFTIAYFLPFLLPFIFNLIAGFLIGGLTTIGNTFGSSFMYYGFLLYPLFGKFEGSQSAFPIINGIFYHLRYLITALILLLISINGAESLGDKYGMYFGLAGAIFTCSMFVHYLYEKNK